MSATNISRQCGVEQFLQYRCSLSKITFCQMDLSCLTMSVTLCWCVCVCVCVCKYIYLYMYVCIYYIHIIMNICIYIIMYTLLIPESGHIQDCLRKLEYCDEVLYFL